MFFLLQMSFIFCFPGTDVHMSIFGKFDVFCFRSLDIYCRVSNGDAPFIGTAFGNLLNFRA